MKPNCFIKVTLAACVLAFTACSSDDDKKVETQESLVESIKTSSDIDAVTDDLLYIIENEYAQQSTAGRSPQGTLTLLPECVTATSTASGGTWQTTLDFGTTGCQMPNGNILKGIITINGTTDFSAMSQTINYSFDGFYHNNRLIEGDRFVTRMLSNNNGNPQSTIDLDLSVTFADGTVVTREGERIWEWIEGVDTLLNPFDNVFLVTGLWITAFPDNSLTTEVGAPLRIAGNCTHITQGTLNFSTNSNGLLLDYGNGTCDNIATVSINNGPANTISLGN